MTRTPILNLNLDPASKTPMFAQIYDALRTRIISGELHPETRLPASRRLAEEVAVSRATIVAAYDQLVAEGFAEGRTGSGIYVCDIGSVELPGTAPALPFDLDIDYEPQAPLQPGRPDMAAFPHRTWGKCFARVARNTPEALSLGLDSFGDPHLRKAIADYVGEWRGYSVSPARIIITSGAAEAVELCVRTITSRSADIGMEDPGFGPLRSLVRSLGLQPKWMDRDDQGPLPPPNAPFCPTIAMVTPSSQFPLGSTMTTARRVEFLTWARNNGTWLIEDDYDSEFRYGGRPIPAMASLDQYGRTFYIGSFSKIFSDTLRLGFLIVPDFYIDRMRETQRAYQTKAALAPQRPLAEFMENGDFARHIRRTRRVYGERRQHLLGLLDQHLNDFATWTDTHAGMHIVLNLDDTYDDVALSRAAAHEGVICPPLSGYYANPQRKSGLLLGFCAFEPHDMTRAVKVLKTVLTAQDKA